LLRTTQSLARNCRHLLPSSPDRKQTESVLVSIFIFISIFHHKSNQINLNTTQHWIITSYAMVNPSPPAPNFAAFNAAFNGMAAEGNDTSSPHEILAQHSV
jgi:hypothetical protein